MVIHEISDVTHRKILRKCVEPCLVFDLIEQIGLGMEEAKVSWQERSSVSFRILLERRSV